MNRIGNAVLAAVERAGGAEEYETLVRRIGESLVMLGAVDRAAWRRMIEAIESHGVGSPERSGAVFGVNLCLLFACRLHQALSPAEQAAALEKARLGVN